MAKRILVIEDNEDIALVVATTLKLRNYEVLTATDGVQGMKMAFSTAFDLIILDILLPELDGYQVLQKLKSNPQTENVPIALFSAHVNEQERRHALQAGAAAVLLKPFEPRQFIQEIGALLNE